MESRAFRHCERSEAIHLAVIERQAHVQRRRGLLRFARNDGNGLSRRCAAMAPLDAFARLDWDLF